MVYVVTADVDVIGVYTDRSLILPDLEEKMEDVSKLVFDEDDKNTVRGVIGGWEENVAYITEYKLKEPLGEKKQVIRALPHSWHEYMVIKKALQDLGASQDVAIHDIIQRFDTLWEDL